GRGASREHGVGQVGMRLVPLEPESVDTREIDAEAIEAAHGEARELEADEPHATHAARRQLDVGGCQRIGRRHPDALGLRPGLLQHDRATRARRPDETDALLGHPQGAGVTRPAVWPRPDAFGRPGGRGVAGGAGRPPGRGDDGPGAARRRPGAGRRGPRAPLLWWGVVAWLLLLAAAMHGLRPALVLHVPLVLALGVVVLALVTPERAQGRRVDRRLPPPAPAPRCAVGPGAIISTPGRAL